MAITSHGSLPNDRDPIIPLSDHKISWRQWAGPAVSRTAGLQRNPTKEGYAGCGGEIQIAAHSASQLGVGSRQNENRNVSCTARPSRELLTTPNPAERGVALAGIRLPLASYGRLTALDAVARFAMFIVLLRPVKMTELSAL